MLFRDENPVFGPGAQVEIPTGGTAPTLVNLQVFEAIAISNVAAAGAVNQVLFTTPQNFSNATAGSFGSGKYALMGVAVRFSTTSTSGTLQIEKTPSATAVGSGTNILSGTVSLSGTANTVVFGYPSSSVAAATNLLSNGDSFSAIFAGTLTGLVGMTITLYIARVA
jgi:hypothetical protein